MGEYSGSPNNPAALVARDFGWPADRERITEEELLRLLSDEVAYWIEHKLEALLSLMYRLDISERKIAKALALQDQTPANVALARLIIDRQKARLATKAAYKTPKLEDEEEWNL